MKKSGSSMILVLSVTSIIIVLITITLRTAVSTFDLSLEKTKHEQQFWALHSYEGYALAYLHKNASYINNSITLSPFIFEGYSGIIEMVPEENNIRVNIQVSYNDEIPQKIMFSYNILADSISTQTIITISHWQTDEVV